jgi:chorismate dehydratase
MLKLGHIIYSNCYPPHSGILLQKVQFPFKLVEGVPTQLNRMLNEGAIDVSPSSSIEYAVNPGQYLIMPGMSITSKTNVMSILLESNVPIEELNDSIVALTTASATSVVLLRILLELRYSQSPRYVLYEQGVEDPSNRAAAILTIGDLAIQRSMTTTYSYHYDLGQLWHEFTGLPFVFALWQIRYRKNIHKELKRLHDILGKSKVFGTSHLKELSEEATKRFSLPPDILFAYWNLFSYNFNEKERQGLLTFYDYAAEIGAIETVKELRFFS